MHSSNMLFSLALTLLLAIETHAQAQTASDVILSGTQPSDSSINVGVPTGSQVSYLSYSTTASFNASTVRFETFMAMPNTSAPTTTSTSTSVSLLRGTVVASSPSSLNATTTRNSTVGRTTSSSAIPTNTQACNSYPEFCYRKYSNITYVGAHNSPFVAPHNAAANQQLRVLDQLNDGIRLLTGETHYNATTNTISYCHTSCDLLDVGTAEEYFTNISSWISTHPYDIVTLLLVNSDFIRVGNYTTPLINSGLAKYAYVLPIIPMNISSWPNLSEMILTGKRAVIFMDYDANQTEVPYILDEFSQMWETPFSPTNIIFPCTEQRPPGLSSQDAEGRMYLANHNLNTEIYLAGTSILVPNTVLMNQTNGLNEMGSLGLMANNCAAEWPRPPSFLLVDYFNDGSYPGSVFEVAAQMNNVTYNRPCCGQRTSAAYRVLPSGASLSLISGVMGTVVLLW